MFRMFNDGQCECLTVLLAVWIGVTSAVLSSQPRASGHPSVSMRGALLENLNKFSDESTSSQGSLEMLNARSPRHENVSDQRKRELFKSPLKMSVVKASLSRTSPISNTLQIDSRSMKSGDLKKTRRSSRDCKLREEGAEKDIRGARITFYKCQAYRKARKNAKAHQRGHNIVEKMVVLPSPGTSNVVIRNGSLEDRQLSAVDQESNDWAGYLTNTNSNGDRRSSPLSQPSDRRAFGVESGGYDQIVQPIQPISNGPPAFVPPSPLGPGVDSYGGQLESAGGLATAPPRLLYGTEAPISMIQVNPAAMPTPPPQYSSYSQQSSYGQNPQSLLTEYAPPTAQPPFHGSETGSNEYHNQYDDNDEPIDFDSNRPQFMSQQESCYPPSPLCDREGVFMDASGPSMRTDQRCNSMRLREIIISNIITGDAEGSKRAIQLVAEQELGTFYNVMCGTGFFSYIAHAEEFCLTAKSGVNCYVFSPSCSPLQMGGIMKKRKTARRKSFLSMN